MDLRGSTDDFSIHHVEGRFTQEVLIGTFDNVFVIWKPVTIECCGEERREGEKDGGKEGGMEGGKEGGREGKREIYTSLLTHLSSQVTMNNLYTPLRKYMCNNRPSLVGLQMLNKDLSYQTTTICELYHTQYCLYTLGHVCVQTRDICKIPSYPVPT